MAGNPNLLSWYARSRVQRASVALGTHCTVTRYPLVHPPRDLAVASFHFPCGREEGPGDWSGRAGAGRHQGLPETRAWAFCLTSRARPLFHQSTSPAGVPAPQDSSSAKAGPSPPRHPGSEASSDQTPQTRPESRFFHSVFIYSKVHMFCTHQQQRGSKHLQGRKAGVSEPLAAREQQT